MTPAQTRYQIALPSGRVCASGFASATEACIWALQELTPRGQLWEWQVAK